MEIDTQQHDPPDLDNDGTPGIQGTCVVDVGLGCYLVVRPGGRIVCTETRRDLAEARRLIESSRG